MKKVPESHPRHDSLKQRELLVRGFKEGATALEGLIAFGRGEAFDYLLGEKTSDIAMKAIEVSAALLLQADNPVISVNGNTALLVPKELVQLAYAVNAKLEVNLFYRTEKRARAIEKILMKNGAKKVYGVKTSALLKGLESERRKVDRNGIYSADVVFVALEDGDRTKALVSSGKKVIAVDLNPLSRTSKEATVTVVDNVVRTVSLLIKAVERLKGMDEELLETLIRDFDNKKNLQDSLKLIKEGFKYPEADL